MKKLILIILLTFTWNSLKSQSFIDGGYMSHDVIDSNTIKIYVEWYQNYANAKMNEIDSQFVHLSFCVGDINNPKSKVVTFRRKIKGNFLNNTQLNTGYTPKLTPEDSTSQRVFKLESKMVYIDTIELSSNPFDSLISRYGKDKLTFIASYDILGLAPPNNVIKTKFSLYTTTELNHVIKYFNNQNTSAQPQTSAANFVNINTVNANLNFIDLDNDRLKFTLDDFYDFDAKSSTLSKNTYRFSYSRLIPLKTFNGTYGKDEFVTNLRPTLKPPYGFNLDSTSGSIYFYKSIKDLAYISFKIEEWRLNSFQQWVRIATHNHQNRWSFNDDVIPPSITFNRSEYTIIEGDTLNVSIVIQGNNSALDVDYSSNLEHPSMKLQLIKSTSNKIDLNFRWITDSSCVKKEHYYAYINAWDDDGEISQMSSKAVKIRVLPRIKYENLSRDTTCNRLVYQVVHPKVPGNPRYQWEVKSKSGYYSKNFQSNGFITEPLPNDTYYITSIIVHDSLGFKPQTDTVILNQKPEIYFLGDTGFCQNTALDFRLDTAHLKDLALIRMTSSSGMLKKSQLTGNLSEADSVTKLWFEISDSRGCIARDSVVVKEFPQESRVWTAIPAGCSTGSQVFLNALWGDFRERKTEIRNTDAWVVWKDSNVYLDPQKVPQSGFKNGIKILDLFLSYNDSWQCRQQDTVKWLVEQPVEAVLKDTSICQNTGILDLDALIVKPNLSQSDYQAIWKLVSSPAGVPSGSVMMSENRMNLGASQEKGRAGTYQFAVSFKKYAGGCTQWDTVQVTVINEPVLTLSPQTLCRDREEYDLYKSVRVDGKPAATGRFAWDSYNWDKKAPELGSYGIINGNLVPKDIVAGNWRVRYEGPLAGCMDTGYFTVRVFHSPVADIQMSSPQDLNIHAAELQATHSSYIDDNTKLTWLWDAGDTTSKTDTSSAFVFKYRYPKIVGDYPLELRVMSNMGCRDTARMMIAVTDNAGVSQVDLDAVYRINSQGEVMILNSAWELVDMRWYDLKGSEIGSPLAGVNVYRVVLKRGAEMRQDSGKWVKE
jgi:hypothetical protein